jgi:hypothetical protein
MREDLPPARMIAAASNIERDQLLADVCGRSPTRAWKPVRDRAFGGVPRRVALIPRLVLSSSVFSLSIAASVSARSSCQSRDRARQVLTEQRGCTTIEL